MRLLIRFSRKTEVGSNCLKCLSILSLLHFIRIETAKWWRATHIIFRTTRVGFAACSCLSLASTTPSVLHRKYLAGEPRQAARTTNAARCRGCRKLFQGQDTKNVESSIFWAQPKDDMTAETALVRLARATGAPPASRCRPSSPPPHSPKSTCCKPFETFLHGYHKDAVDEGRALL